MPATTIDELVLADDPERWARLGFTVRDGCCLLGTVRLRFVDAAHARGIVGWSLRDVASTALDGLPTTHSRRPPRGVERDAVEQEGVTQNATAQDAVEPERATQNAIAQDAVEHEAIPGEQRAEGHPNGVVAIDHVVAMSPDLDRSVRALQEAGLQLRRIREEPTPAGAPRQAFFRLGAEILELVQEPYEVVERAARAGGGARFWGLALRAPDLQRTVDALGEHVGSIRPAVQPGRQIATLRRSAGVAVPIAFMSEPARS
jgi:catechol 2,3-dioxygenase-like lactoylglutathione lyase family enzyme